MKEADKDLGITLSWTAAPKWDLVALEKSSPSTRERGINTSSELPAKPSAIQPSGDADVQAQLRRLKNELEAKLKEAQAQAEMWKQKYEDVLQKLADESAKADKLLADLRNRLLEMEW